MYSTVKVPIQVSAPLYVAIWIMCLGGLFLIRRQSKKKGSSSKWTTQDILSLAIIGVMLMLYNSLIADRFIDPLAKSIPVVGSFLNFWGIKSLPYQFILITGIAIIRKPGVATGLIFIKYLLEQLIFSSSGVDPLKWPGFIYQGLFIDLYILARGEKLLNPRSLVIDAFIIGFIKDMPRTQFDDFIMGPFLGSKTTTLAKDLLQTVHDAVSHAIYTALFVHLGVRVAKSVTQMGGRAQINVPAETKN